MILISKFIQNSATITLAAALAATAPAAALAYPTLKIDRSTGEYSCVFDAAGHELNLASCLSESVIALPGELLTLVNANGFDEIIGITKAVPSQQLQACEDLVRAAHPILYSSNLFVCYAGDPARVVREYDAPGYWFFGGQP